MPSRSMAISPRWAQVALLTFLVGFATLGYLAYSIYRDHPPIPARVVAPSGQVLFTNADVMTGQHTFQKYGLMQFGSIFGHGAYLGPDFTAQYIHLATQEMRTWFLTQGLDEDQTNARVQQDFKRNAFDAVTGTLTFSEAQAYAFGKMVDFYRGWFGQPEHQRGLKRPPLTAPEEIKGLTSYFAWAGWVATAVRPGKPYSYTNNWPPAPEAGNILTAEAMLWSVLSLIALLGGTGILFFVFGSSTVIGREA